MPDTAMLLDSLELQLPIGPTPRLSLGSHREVCYDPPVTSWRVCSDVAGPFVFVSTSEVCQYQASKIILPLVIVFKGSCLTRCLVCFPPPFCFAF